MQSPRARASSPKEVVKEKKTKVKAKVTGGKSENQSGKGKSSNGCQNPNKDKECHYCHKKGHLKSDCRQRMKDEKGKGKGGKISAAAVPQEEPQSEPLSATIADESDSWIAGVFNSQMILVDTGAGAHMFSKDFDPHARTKPPVTKSNLVTVTGEPLAMGSRKKSLIETESKFGDSCKFTVEYDESEKMQFSVLPAGKSADVGVWTVIGPETQCLITSRDTPKVHQMLNSLNTIPLVKNRGVDWLRTKFLEQKTAGGTANPAGGTAGTSAGGTAGCPGALKAAVKTVPAKLLEDGEGAAQPSGEGMASGSSGSSSGSSSVPVVVDIEIPRGDAQVEQSEEGRKPRAKKIPENVSSEEFHAHMLTHIPMRSWCDHCVKGKSREDDHKPRVESKDPNEVPRVRMDYCFLGHVAKGTEFLVGEND